MIVMHNIQHIQQIRSTEVVHSYLYHMMDVYSVRTEYGVNEQLLKRSIRKPDTTDVELAGVV